MPRPPRPGEYRHQPAPVMARGPDGVLRPTRTRHRFPFRGLVVAVSGTAGTAVCATVSWLFHATGNARLLPRTVVENVLPRAPSVENILFGAGFAETMLVCAASGYWLWSILWRQPVPESAQKSRWGALPSLLVPGLLVGPTLALFSIPACVFFLYLRTAPAAQPWPVRPFFALLAAPLGTATALSTLVIPTVVLLLGALLGITAAAAVTLLRPHFPEEPDV